jgi:hypothetical protein
MEISAQTPLSGVTIPLPPREKSVRSRRWITRVGDWFTASRCAAVSALSRPVKFGVRGNERCIAVIGQADHAIPDCDCLRDCVVGRHDG